MRKLASLSLDLFRQSRGRVKIAAAVGLCLLLAAVTGSLLLNNPARADVTSSANIVILSDGGAMQTIPTTMPTVGKLLDNLGVKIHPGDVVEPALTAPINQDDFRVNIYRARPVEIVDGMHKTYTFSAAVSPRVVAEQAGITVYPEDSLTRGPVTDFADSGAIGDEITIDRATPVNLMLYGSSAVVRTHAKTVGELIEQKGIKLASGDTLTPAADTPLTAGMEVAVNHQGIDYQTVEEVIPAPVQYVDDSSLSIGSSAVRQAGSAGQQQTTYEVITKNGREVSRTEVQSIVTVDPVTEIVATGTALVQGSNSHQAWMQAAGINPDDYGFVNYIVDHEGGSWNPCEVQGGAINCNYSGLAGYGLVQATPGYKMSSAGADWQVNPVTQLRWATDYAQSRYGSWQSAYNHWLYSHNW